MLRESRPEDLETDVYRNHARLEESEDDEDEDGGKIDYTTRYMMTYVSTLRECLVLLWRQQVRGNQALLLAKAAQQARCRDYVWGYPHTQAAPR